MANLPFGVQMWSVRNEFAHDPLATLKALATMGFNGVEFAGPPGGSAALLRAMLDEAGLVCCGWHTGYDQVQDDRLAETIALNKAVGNKRVIIPGLPKELTSTLEGWKKAATFLNELADKLAPHDMVTGYHNHFHEFAPMEGEVPWDFLAANTDRRVILQFDTGNAAAGKGDAVEFLKKHPGRGGTVHLKPYSPSEGDLWRGFRRVIGDDELNWPEILRLCQSTVGAEWLIVEYESDLLPTLQGVESCLKNIRKLMK